MGNAKSLHLLLAIMAASLVAVVPDSRAEGWAGRVSAAVGQQKITSTDDPDDGTTSIGAISAAAIYHISDAFYIQGTLQAEKYNIQGFQAPKRGVMYGLHFGWRTPERWMAGLFFSKGEANINDEPSGYKNSGSVSGVETQIFFDDFTVFAQAGIGNIEVDTNEGFVEGWFYRLGGRFFPNSRVMAEMEYTGAYTGSYIDGHDPGDWDSFEVKLLAQVSGPIHAFASFRASQYYAIDEDDSANDRTVLLGFELRTSGSVREFDRNGASLSLPMAIVRGATFTEALD